MVDVAGIEHDPKSVDVSVLSGEDAVSKPAYRVRKGVAFFRLGIGLFLALSGLLAIASCSFSASTSVKWQDGMKVLGEKALFDLVLSNVSDKTPVAQVQSMLSEVEISSLGRTQEQDLLLVRFNSDVVCGRLGCLHTIVSRDSDKAVTAQIWNHYLHPDIPVGSALTLVPPPNGDVEPGDFSCLQISQVTIGALVHTTQCYENGSYRVVAEEQSVL